MGNIWLIGGTSDSVSIASYIAEIDLPLIITVTTPEAINLYGEKFTVIAKCLKEGEIETFCIDWQIDVIIDASHPFAIAISLSAIAISQKLKIPYLRYERKSHSKNINSETEKNNIVLDSFETLLRWNYLQGERVLLTVGCKVLPQFKSWQKEAILFARILPKIESVEIAKMSGFTSDRIIAIRPPLSIELETALWKNWDISLVVTKASGKAGGEDIKNTVAKNLGIRLITISRPQITYPQKTSGIEEVINFCQSLYFKEISPT